MKMTSQISKVLTRDDVQDIEDALPVPGERPLRTARIGKIIDWISCGKFCRANFAVAHCVSDGNTYRINGQHTAWVLRTLIENESRSTPNAELPKFPEDVPLVIEKWEVDNPWELVMVFDTYDNPASVRSNGDKLGVYVAEHPDLAGVSKRVVAACVKGVNYSRKSSIAIDPSACVFSQRETGMLLQEPVVRRFVLFVNRLNQSATWRGYLQDKDICAVVYDTWRMDAATAEAVWFELFQETNPDPRSASRRFAAKMNVELNRKSRTKFNTAFRRYFADQIRQQQLSK